MKKLMLLFVVVVAFILPNNLNAQTDADVVNFTVILNDLYDIEVIDGENQTATFTNALEYNGGVWEGAGIASGVSEVTMETTGNWNVTIDAADFGPANPNMIPIENLGVWVTELGDHSIATGEVTFTCTSEALSQGITNGPLAFISKGANDNAGDASDNWFQLHWRMGTQDNASMYPGSMFDQIATGDFLTGATYTTVVNLTLTATP